MAYIISFYKKKYMYIYIYIYNKWYPFENKQEYDEKKENNKNNHHDNIRLVRSRIYNSYTFSGLKLFEFRWY